MKTKESISSSVSHSRLTAQVIATSNVFIDVLITLAIVALTVYAVNLLYGLAINLLARNFGSSFHDIIYIIVIVKAYKIFQSYLVSHRISVEYVLEVAIIASFIEVIFAYDQHNIVTVIVLGVFGISNLIIYFLWVKSIKEVTSRLGKLMR